MLLSAGMTGTSKSIFDNAPVDRLHGKRSQAKSLLKELDAVVGRASDEGGGVVLELGEAARVPAKHCHRGGDAAILEDQVLGHRSLIRDVPRLHDQPLDVALGFDLEHGELGQADVALGEAGSGVAACGVRALEAANDAEPLELRARVVAGERPFLVTGEDAAGPEDAEPEAQQARQDFLSTPVL